MTTETQIEQDLIARLTDLKYSYRPDIRDRAALEDNFRKHFETLNRVHLTDKCLSAHKIGRLWKFQLSVVDEWVRAGGTDEADREGGKDGR